MSNISARIKLFIVIGAFAAFAALMFAYGYGIMDSRNQARMDLVNQKNIELEVLQKEQKNFEQGKIDLANLSEKAFPPQELFSKDTKVVKEIRILEDLAGRYNLDMNLSVAGSSKTATKVPGLTSELYLVPYVLTVTGAYNNIMQFVEAVEHANFVTQTKAIEITATENGQSRAELSSEFYLKK